MSDRPEHLTDDAIAQFLRTRSADAERGLLDEIVRAAGAAPQGRPWLVLRPVAFPRGILLLAALGLLLAAVGAIAIGSRLVPSPQPPATSGEMWPQANLAEVRAAQDRADARDPAYTWQLTVDGGQLGQNHPCSGASLDGGSGIINQVRIGCIRIGAGSSAEIFVRFLQEKLGWEEFLWTEAFAHPEGLNPGDVVFVRCAAGRANSLYPTGPEQPGCAPTMDELRYETVKISVGQPDRQGPTGIWVVTGWEMIEPATQADPRVVEAEARALLEAFLQARVDGAGAEGRATFPEYDPFADERAEQEIPLLYGTINGASYERSELELVEGPLWPHGSMQFAARLFAENGATVVEQVFSLDRDDSGRLRLVYEFEGGPGGAGPGTTENGSAVPEAYGFLDGAVTFRAAYPLGPSQDVERERDRLVIDGLLADDDGPRRILTFLVDPPLIERSCVAGPAPSDAEALARSIVSDPRYEGTAPVAVTIGGLSALQMDGVAAYESSCVVGVVPVSAGSTTRARLYLLDLPGGSARVLAIAIAADEDSFETVMEWAAPIVDSIEFHAP